MAKLIWVSNVSLDGYIEDEHGSFDFTAPDDDLFGFITDLVRPAGIRLYGGECTRRWPLGKLIPPWPPIRAHGRIRHRLASSRQGRLLHDLGLAVDCQDPTRALVRSRLRTRHEDVRHQPSHHSGSDLAGQAFRRGWWLSATSSSDPSSSAEANPLLGGT